MAEDQDRFMDRLFSPPGGGTVGTGVAGSSCPQIVNMSAEYRSTGSLQHCSQATHDLVTESPCPCGTRTAPGAYPETTQRTVPGGMRERRCLVLMAVSHA
eukprot:365906-Chlamydomonas_euryale.AAC.8